MQAIYEPKGRAREYCERAVNLYRGCAHGCAYCYSPSVLRMTRDDFSRQRERPGILDALRREAPRHAGCEVLLCFTCDPYSREFNPVTSEAIEILHDAGCAVRILTKGGNRSAVDLPLLIRVDKYGATLTADNAADSLRWEPGAAPTIERIAVLALAHERGIETWASLEPVIDPKQSLRLITMTRDVVRTYKIGRWNYDKRANEIDWHRFAHDAVDLCERYGVRCVLKKDLEVYL